MLLVDRAVNLTMWSFFLFIFRQQLHLSHQSLIFCLIFSALTFQIVYIDLVDLASVMAIEDNYYYIIAQRYKNFLVTVEKYFTSEHTKREIWFVQAVM